MEPVLFKVVELNALSAFVQITVFLDNGVPVAFAASAGIFPGVGQEDAPVNRFR